MSEANPCPTCGYQIDRVERLNTENARLKETIRAFGRGDIVPITDKDAEMERLRAIAVRAQLVVNEWHAYGGVKEPIVDQLVALEELLGNEQETRE